MTEAKNAEEVEVTEIKPKKVKKSLPNIKYLKEDFEVEKTFEDNRGMYQKWVNLPQFNNHVGKCNKRVCFELDASMDHLQYCYEVLNGRVIDGFLINDLIDRYGFQGAENVNRVALVTRYNEINQTNKNVNALKTAFIKLKKIVTDRNPLERFMKYQKEYEDLLLKERRDKIVDGQ